jgi:uncharacterized protein
MANANETSALIIEHIVKRGEEKRYEQWTTDILNAVSRSPGYLGREVFPAAGAGKPYRVIVRFQTAGDLQNWLESAERRLFIEQIQDALTTGDQVRVQAGIDVWFTSPDAPLRPKPYKQFLLTAAAIYPLTLIVPRLLAPLLSAVPFLAQPLIANLFVTAIVVALMTWVVMPRLTGWLHDWLFDAGGRETYKPDVGEIKL